MSSSSTTTKPAVFEEKFGDDTVLFVEGGGTVEVHLGHNVPDHFNKYVAYYGAETRGGWTEATFSRDTILVVRMDDWSDRPFHVSFARPWRRDAEDTGNDIRMGYCEAPRDGLSPSFLRYALKQVLNVPPMNVKGGGAIPLYDDEVAISATTTGRQVWILTDSDIADIRKAVPPLRKTGTPRTVEVCLSIQANSTEQWDGVNILRFDRNYAVQFNSYTFLRGVVSEGRCNAPEGHMHQHFAITYDTGNFQVTSIVNEYGKPCEHAALNWRAPWDRRLEEANLCNYVTAVVGKPLQARIRTELGIN